MTDDLEAALRRAVGLDVPEPEEEETEKPLPTAVTLALPGPPALNSDQLLNNLHTALGGFTEGF